MNMLGSSIIKTFFLAFKKFFFFPFSPKKKHFSIIVEYLGNRIKTNG